MIIALFFVACTDIIVQELPLPSEAPYLVILFHGSGDTANDWPLELQTAIADVNASTNQWDIWAYDWDEYASSRQSASSYGLQLGELLAFELLEEPYSYQHFHLVAHSVGSFVGLDTKRSLICLSLWLWGCFSEHLDFGHPHAHTNRSLVAVFHLGPENPNPHISLFPTPQFWPTQPGPSRARARGPNPAQNFGRTKILK